MKNRNPIMQTMALVLIATAGTPALAASLVSTSPAQPMPESTAGSTIADNGIPAPDTFDSWSPGSAALVPVVVADSQAGNPAPANAVDEDSGGIKQPVDDIAFVNQATESGRKEVAAARDALPQLKKPELKRIAEMLVNDHSGANEKLARIAQTKGWPVPAPEAPAAPPSGTAGGDFDARWTADMIAGHERSVALYRAQAQGGQDADLRQYARDTLPTIEHHLEELRSTQK
jgi:putative membrane protein